MIARLSVKTAITVVTPPARRLYCGGTAVMEVLLWRHGGDGGATAVLVRCHGGHGGAAAIPLRIGPTRGGIAEVLNMFKVSAVPSRRSAVLTVSRGATASMMGPLRNHRDHSGATAVYAVQAPQWKISPPHIRRKVASNADRCLQEDDPRYSLHGQRPAKHRLPFRNSFFDST